MDKDGRGAYLAHLNFLHPLAIAAYVVIAVAFLCMVSSSADSADYHPDRAIQYCMDQATHLAKGKPADNAALQLVKLACALAYVSSARALAPDSTKILQQTRVDPTELSTAVIKAAQPLLLRAQIPGNEFRAMFS